MEDAFNDAIRKFVRTAALSIDGTVDGSRFRPVGGDRRDVVLEREVPLLRYDTSWRAPEAGEL